MPIGHEAVHVFDLGLAGASDDVIFDHAFAERRIIITLDLGFGEIGSGRPVGVVIVRSRKKIEIGELIDHVMQMIRRFAPELEDFDGKVLVLEPGRSRLRPRTPDQTP
jgi:predicted nuclease of predicted toxin-antitoxin system